jgi:general secretion pathway protein A
MVSRRCRFNITPDPRFLYLSRHPPGGAPASEIWRAARKKGFIVLIGEVGCGKTTLCRRFLNELDPAHYDTALVLNPRVTETQMLKAILTELGEPKLARSQERPRRPNEPRAARAHRPHQAREIVLIIDEAQNLSNEVLEQIRLLSNLETDQQKLLQIVLMGQTELKDRARSAEELRQLRQRILVHYELRIRFAARPTSDHYIQHRLSLAGGIRSPPRSLGGPCAHSSPRQQRHSAHFEQPLRQGHALGLHPRIRRGELLGRSSRRQGPGEADGLIRTELTKFQ